MPAPRSPSPGPEHREDWEVLWLRASGPRVPAEDLAFMGELFDRLDRNDDGVVQAAELGIFRSALAAAAEASAGLVVEEDSDGDADGAVADVDAAGWASFHAAALAAYGLAAWRRGLVSTAAVCRITRTSAAPIEEEPWTISVGPGGEIVAAWFSQAELRAEEKAACRALVNAGGWRCLSCEAEALEPHAIGAPVLSRATTERPSVTSLEFAPPEASSMKKASSHQVSFVGGIPDFRHSFGASHNFLAPPPPDTARSAPTPKAAASGDESGRSWRSSLWRCQSLREMLSHRALRPVRKPTRVGDRVVIESVGKGTARKGDLGARGTVSEIWVPEDEVVKQEWCKLQLGDGEHPNEVLLPLRSVVDLKVVLRPGDLVEVYRPIESGRCRGERSPEAHKATVLRIDERSPHLVEVGFGAGEAAKVRLSWVRRAEMSAWTQVLRRAPYSTVMFLLFDLCLTPETAEDLRELDDRIRRDFQPRGRFRFLGLGGAWREPDDRDAELSPNRRRSKEGEGSPSRTRLAVGDCGKILSFDLDALHAEVLPDRKKHLRLEVPLDSLQPDPCVLDSVAVGGLTAMYAFDEDPPILASIKRRDVKGLRKLLAEVGASALPRTLLEETVDADGNTAFHAAVYEQSEEMWRIAWSALCNCSAAREGDQQAALTAVNDWGRSPLWVALECGNAKLCGLLLRAGAPVDQEGPVLASAEDRFAPHDFCGGPGLVASGVRFEVTLYTPSATCGLRFGNPAAGGGHGHARSDSEPGRQFVVVRTCGEPAEACVMPGDVLLAVGAEPASGFASFGQLEHRLAAAARPLTLEFLKGSGLFIQPLHRACELGSDEVVRLLLDHGADPAWRDACGRCAMDRAVRKRNRKPQEERPPYERCVALLAEAGGSQEGHVKVLDADGVEQPFEPPAHWRPCPEMLLEGRFWLRVEEVRCAQVLSHMQRVMDRSVGTSGFKKTTTKDRRGRVPTKLMVERVQRIENVASLTEYLHRRHAIRRAIRAGGDVEKVGDDLKVKVFYGELTGAGAEVVSPLEEGLNEVFLFHGTSAAGAGGIALDDFRLSLAGSNAGDAFGRGIYFAEDCMKCDEYTQEAPYGHKFAGLRPVLLCRVLLGRAAVSEDRDVSWELDAIMQRKYDSLIADRKAAVGTYREFIIFDADQVYADYVLWYRRSY